MPPVDFTAWTSCLEQTLQGYDESLLRQIASRLIKPRNQWPVPELVERCVAAVNNLAVIDRRLKELSPSERRLLAAMGHSGQPRWRVVNLIELAATLGEADGLQPVRRLLETGLLYPDLSGPSKKLRNFNQWLAQSGVTGHWVFTHPNVSQRALGDELGLPSCPAIAIQAESVHEADGLEWLLRLAVLRQRVMEEPLRRTQQGEFFKRDLERLQSDPLLNQSPADALAELPETGVLMASLAVASGILREEKGELQAAELPGCWKEGLLSALASLWAALPLLDDWAPAFRYDVLAEGGIALTHSRERGYTNDLPPLRQIEKWRKGVGLQATGNPYVSAFLAVLLCLNQLPKHAWARPADLEGWILKHHPYWSPGACEAQLGPGTPHYEASEAPTELSTPHSALSTFLLGFAYQLKLLQAAKDDQGGWLVRLSAVGRWLLGVGEKPAEPAASGGSLLVQPNLEIVAYRQGLTPDLIAKLTRFAVWKNLGAACLLQIQPESIYQALETGQTLESIVQTLQQHGSKPTPPTVLDLLRTWTCKRERLSVYPSAVLLEFANPADLNEALARGLPGARISDRLVVVAEENKIDFRNFRLTGTRDYGLPPEKCVDIEDDGITLSIDLSRSDLLVETELRRFAQPLDMAAANGRPQYCLTAASLASGQAGGLGLRALEEWFTQRTGQPLAPAARLLLTGPVQLPVALRPQLVLQVGSPEVADGLLQLPATRPLIQARLGPTALAIAEEHVDELRRGLEELGLGFQN